MQSNRYLINELTSLIPHTMPKPNKFTDNKTGLALRLAMLMEFYTRSKYEIYAKIAESNGLIQVKDMLLELSKNEYEHGKVWFKELGLKDKPIHPESHEGEPILTSPYATINNLSSALKTELTESDSFYPDLAKIAESEGFNDIAEKFKLTASIEEHHASLLNKVIEILDNLPRGSITMDEGNTEPNKIYAWKCTNCGNIHMGTEPPDECPVCSHPGSFYELVE